MKVEPEEEAAGINDGRAEASAADQYGHTGEGEVGGGGGSGLAVGFDLAPLDGTNAGSASGGGDGAAAVKFRSGCWWVLAVNRVLLLLLGDASQQANQWQALSDELRWSQVT